MKKHNHTLQTNPWHREEEPQNIYITRQWQDKESQATISPFLVKIVSEYDMEILHSQTADKYLTSGGRAKQ